MATITCKCGAVRLCFHADTELFRHECCCHDCISALWYSTRRGGPQYPETSCADCCWLPNDFSIESGAARIGAFMNYAGADTTRYYCTSCWTILFQDHPLYEQRIVVSQVAAYAEFHGLTDVVRMAPQARHFVKDLDPQQVAALPPWSGDPAHVYQGVAENLLANFPAMKAAGGCGADMNAGALLRQTGGASVPDDAPRLAAGPPSLLRQNTDAAARG